MDITVGLPLLQGLGLPLAESSGVPVGRAPLGETEAEAVLLADRDADSELHPELLGELEADAVTEQDAGIVTLPELEKVGEVELEAEDDAETEAELDDEPLNVTEGEPLPDTVTLEEGLAEPQLDGDCETDAVLEPQSEALLETL